MTTSEFQSLLDRSEGPTLDFKLQHYDFSGTDGEEVLRKRGDFLKDIVSMANTPRSDSAYLVLGVKRLLDGKVEIPGLNRHVDDNYLQQQVEGLVYPPPQFCYLQVQFEGKQFAVI